jgi:hypothetical protein
MRCKRVFQSQDFFTTMTTELDRSRLQLFQLGEKFTELDNWQEERLTEVTTQLYQDMEMKEETLKKL